MTIRSILSYSLLAGSLAACSGPAQQPEALQALPMETLDLNGRDAFRAGNDNWRIAGNVSADRKAQHQLQPADGKGILVYQPQAGHTDLLTQWEHRDMDLELDYMLSAGSNAFILLQGRYPFPLEDHWGKDSGVCKAPGLWQHLELHFRAPRADSAALALVKVNGRTVAVGITEQQGTAPGPLVFRGGNGPVAFRNIRYKTYQDERLQLADMRYCVYKGVYKNHDTLQQFTPVRTGPTDTLSCHTGDKRAQLVVEGTLLPPRPGDYLFSLRAGGPVRLLVDGKEVANNNGTRNYEEAYYGKVALDTGKHSFQLSYANYDECLVLQYEGPHIPFTVLTTNASERKTVQPEPLEIPVKGTAVVQRGFMQHGDGVDPYNIAVGLPGGYSYAYDLVNYSLLCAWRGAFLNVAEMWRERGEKQLEEPLGATLSFSGLPSVAVLEQPDASWPGPMQPDSSRYSNRGYRLLPDGRPVFFYTFSDVQVEDQLYRRDDGKGLERDITMKSHRPAGNRYCLLADGSAIEKLPDGSYAVDDKRYYIETASQPQIQGSKGQYRLQVPVSGDAHIHYTIIW